MKSPREDHADFLIAVNTMEEKRAQRFVEFTKAKGVTLDPNHARGILVLAEEFINEERCEE